MPDPATVILNLVSSTCLVRLHPGGLCRIATPEHPLK